MVNRTAWLAAGCLALALAATACSAPAPVRVASLPVIDALPVSMALYKPVFAENDLSVKLVTFETTAQLRESLRNGQADAIITDIVTALQVTVEGRGRIVRTALKSTRSRPMYAIAAGQPLPREGARIAVGGADVERYAAARLLSYAGVRRWDAVDVVTWQERVEEVGKGRADAALLCGDEIKAARETGCGVLIDDGELTVAPAVVVFSERMANDKPAIVRRFLRAYEQSVRELNVRPWHYLSLTASLVRQPEAVRELPLYPFPGEAPTVSDVEAASAWLAANGLSSQVVYSRAVNGGFLWDPYLFRPAACCGW